MLTTALFAAFFTGAWALGRGVCKGDVRLLCLALVLIAVPARLLFSMKWLCTGHDLLVLGAFSTGLVWSGWASGRQEARESGH